MLPPSGWATRKKLPTRPIVGVANAEVRVWVQIDCEQVDSGLEVAEVVLFLPTPVEVHVRAEAFRNCLIKLKCSLVEAHAGLVVVYDLIVVSEVHLRRHDEHRELELHLGHV